MNDKFPEAGAVAKLHITGKLGVGKYALVDAEIYPYLSQFKWSLFISKRHNIEYARRSIYRKGMSPTALSLHREVMGVTNPKIHIDHINGNGLDNQKKNLRIVTRSENLSNSKRRKDNTSGIKGVFPHGNRWRAQIGKNGRKIYLGTFDEIEWAKEARKSAERLYHGQYARI